MKPVFTLHKKRVIVLTHEKTAAGLTSKSKNGLQPLGFPLKLS